MESERATGGWPPPERGDPLRTLANWLVHEHRPTESWLSSRLGAPSLSLLWQSSTQPADLLVVGSMVELRKAIAAACACARSTQPWIDDGGQLLRALAVAEAWADGREVAVPELDAVLQEAQLAGAVVAERAGGGALGEVQLGPLLSLRDSPYAASAFASESIVAAVGSALCAARAFPQDARRGMCRMGAAALTAMAAHAVRVELLAKPGASRSIGEKHASEAFLRAREAGSQQLAEKVRSILAPPDTELLVIAVQLDQTLRD